MTIDNILLNEERNSILSNVRLQSDLLETRYFEIMEEIPGSPINFFRVPEEAE